MSSLKAVAAGVGALLLIATIGRPAMADMGCVEERGAYSVSACRSGSEFSVSAEVTGQDSGLGVGSVSSGGGVGGLVPVVDSGFDVGVGSDRGLGLLFRRSGGEGGIECWLASDCWWYARSVSSSSVVSVGVSDPLSGVSGVDPVVVGRRAVASVRLPVVVGRSEPMPSDNRWGVLAVGLPLWLGVGVVDRVVSTVVVDGLMVGLEAVRGEVVFDMGDGVGVVTCVGMAERPVWSDPMDRSPNCGYTYLTHGDYMVTVTEKWVVRWTALGHTGVIATTQTGSIPMPIREFHSTITG